MIEQVMDGPVRCPVAPMVPFEDHVYPTRSGRFEFITQLRHEPRVVPDYPLTLVTNYSKKWLLSQILEKEHPSIPSVRIGTETATKYGIESGERAIIRSPVGHLEVEVLVDGASTAWSSCRSAPGSSAEGANVLTETSCQLRPDGGVARRA
jgi:anaerobic selenocysteine-containing dehydrogenase